MKDASRSTTSVPNDFVTSWTCSAIKDVIDLLSSGVPLDALAHKEAAGSVKPTAFLTIRTNGDYSEATKKPWVREAPTVQRVRRRSDLRYRGATSGEVSQSDSIYHRSFQFLHSIGLR